MDVTLWFVIAGLLLIAMALSESFLSRLPLTTSLLYLLVGVAIGPHGLGLLGLHELGDSGWRWLTIDLVWAVTGGLAIGAVLGTLVGHLVIYLRRAYAELVGSDEFLTLGLIALSYGVALLAHSYGFLAVFAAGLALRRVEAQETGGDFDKAIRKFEEHPEEVAPTGEDAPLHMAQEILGFNERLGRIGEVALVVAIGSLLTFDGLTLAVVVFIVLLLAVIRPVAALVGLAGSDSATVQRGMIAWFGIRGIGSVYYLMYAMEQGLKDSAAELMVTVTAIAVSVVVHGVSVTPLMGWYERLKEAPA